MVSVGINLELELTSYLFYKFIAVVSTILLYFRTLFSVRKIPRSYLFPSKSRARLKFLTAKFLVTRCCILFIML